MSSLAILQYKSIAACFEPARKEKYFSPKSTDQMDDEFPSDCFSLWLCDSVVRSSLPVTDSAHEFPRGLAIQINRVAQLLFLDVLTISMRDVNRSRTDQQRLAPVSKKGNVSGEG